MSYVTLDVEIDLDDIDTDDLVKSVISRFKENVSRKKNISDSQKKELKQAATELLQELGVDADAPKLKVQTLDEQYRSEHLIKAFHKYTTAQIEAALPL